MEKNRIAKRLNKLGVNSALNDELLKDIDTACANVLGKLLKNKADDIEFEYDDGVLDLVIYDPEYTQLVDDTVRTIMEKLVSLTEKWAEDTKMYHM